MKCAVTTLDNETAGEIELAEEVFGLPPRAETKDPIVEIDLARLFIV